MGKLLPLIESFRAVLRVHYPKRPTLAEEIRNIYYFHSPFDKSTGWRLDPEVQIADFALAELKDAIASKTVRLYGRLGDKLPQEIEPMEITRNGILVFDNALEVWEPSTDRMPFRMLRTYRNVHCNADDLDERASQQQPTPQQHYPGDAALIEEGVRMAEAGRRFRAIGRALAPRAESDSTIESTEDRLRRAISKEYKRRYPGAQ